MDLRQLRAFIHVAEAGSISGAADRLHTAQPALSRLIQLLERELSVKLFTRHGRGVRLTPEGSMLLVRATSILRELERAREELTSKAGDPVGRAALAVPPTVVELLAGSLGARFVTVYPRVKLRIASGYSGYVEEWLRKGLVDIGVIYDASGRRGLEVQPLLREQLFAVAQPGAFAPERPMEFGDFAASRLILPSPQHGLRRLLDEIALEQGRELAPVVETDSLGAQIALVRRGVGMTALPLGAVFDEIQAGRVSAAPLVDPEVSRKLVVATAHDRPGTAAVNCLRSMLHEEVVRLVESGRWAATLA